MVVKIGVIASDYLPISEVFRLKTFAIGGQVDTPRSKDTGILKEKLWGMNPPKV